MLCFKLNATGDIYSARKGQVSFDVFKENGKWIAQICNFLASGPDASAEFGPFDTSDEAGMMCLAWVLECYKES